MKQTRNDLGDLALPYHDDGTININVVIIIVVISIMQLWRPELELVGISSGSWYHCLPIRTCL